MKFLDIRNNLEIAEILDLALSQSYDKNSMLRIMELYRLRDTMMRHLEEQEAVVPPPTDNRSYQQRSIYSAVLHSVDALLYNFMNDESMQVLNGRELLKLTMSVCIKSLGESNYTFPRRDRVIHEIQNLYQNRNDEIIAGMFLDFAVSIFSAIEIFLSDIYYLKERKDKIIKDERRFRGYIPAKVKIDSVLKLCEHAVKPIESVVINNFVERFDVLREIRNTIHMLGIYSKEKEISYTVNGATVWLRKSKPVTVDDYRFYFYMCEKVVDSYREICSALEVDQVSYIEL